MFIYLANFPIFPARILSFPSQIIDTASYYSLLQISSRVFFNRSVASSCRYSVAPSCLLHHRFFFSAPPLLLHVFFSAQIWSCINFNWSPHSVRHLYPVAFPPYSSSLLHRIFFSTQIWSRIHFNRLPLQSLASSCCYFAMSFLPKFEATSSFLLHNCSFVSSFLPKFIAASTSIGYPLRSVTFILPLLRRVFFPAPPHLL